jgi:hypothetical protein
MMAAAFALSGATIAGVWAWAGWMLTRPARPRGGTK